MGCVPTVEDGYFFVFSTWELLSMQAVVFDIVDSFQIEDSTRCHYGMDDEGLQAEG